MRRREFIAGLGGAAAWPLAGRAQQPAVPMIGYLFAGVPERSAHLVAAFRKGLSEIGFVEGRNVAIEYRFTHNDDARLPELVADLVRRRVEVIATPGATRAALAAKAATTTIPIVFSVANDPVQSGLVASLNRPGGNVTGVSSMNTELGAKRLGLLHELMPLAVRFAVLSRSNSDASVITGLRVAAASMGWQIEVFTASTNREIDAAFASLMQKPADALLVVSATLFYDRRVQVVALAAHHRLPTIYPFRENVEIGGLMSYGTDQADVFRQVGVYAGRILKGEKPADLPVVQPTKYELVINLNTAKALGLAIPETLLATADEVIQ
jgi:putative tryptophan/tyrosine transport system substrate-binding protein